MEKLPLVSGSGNVAQYTVEKLNQLNVKVVTLSDSSGCIYDPDGIDNKKLAFVKQLKNVQRGRIASYVEKYPSAEYISHNGNLDYNPIGIFLQILHSLVQLKMRLTLKMHNILLITT